MSSDISVVFRVPINAHAIPELAPLLAAGATPGNYVTLALTPHAGMGIELVQVLDVNLTPVILDAFDSLELVRMTPAVSEESPKSILERHVRRVLPG